MSLQSLNQVLGNLKHQYKHREQQTLQQVVQGWADIVGPVVAAQTRPLSIQRKVLKVATSSAAWAQNLVFERQRMLDKLNRSLSLQLIDIRFSTAQWHQAQDGLGSSGDKHTEPWHTHPSRLLGGNSERQPPRPELQPVDPVSAFQNWARQMRSRSHHLPLCPQCQCPTPPGEIERWQVCALCAAKRW